MFATNLTELKGEEFLSVVKTKKFDFSSYSDALLNRYMDEFVRSPAVIRQPGFSILAKRDILVQNAMERQGISFDSLARIAQKQFSSRQGIVGPLANIISSTGGVRNSRHNYRNYLILKSKLRYNDYYLRFFIF